MYADYLLRLHGEESERTGELLEAYFKKAVGGVHILPFFPSSGDRGFAPMDYHRVEPAFGDWADVERLAENYYLMFDYMINHISAQSEYYKDFCRKKTLRNTGICFCATRISGRTGSRPKSRWTPSTSGSRGTLRGGALCGRIYGKGMVHV